MFNAISFTDVISTDGAIRFDSNSDNQAEMILNQTGLGIGTTATANLEVNGNVVISGQLDLGGAAGSANLNLQGSLGYSIQTVSENTLLSDDSIVLVDTSSDNVFLTLPYAGNVSGRIYTIKKINEDQKVWVYAGGNQIDQSAPIELENFEYLKVMSTGETWNILSTSPNVGTVAADNLVGYWHFNSASGNTLEDYSGYGHTGIAYKMNSANVSTPALVSNGMNFDGVDDYVRIENSPDLRGMAQLTVCAWVYIRSKSNYAAIVAKTDNHVNNGDRTFRMQIDESSDKFRYMCFTDVGNKTIKSDATAPLNEWVFIMIWYDGANTRMYVNAELQSSQGTLTGNIHDDSDVRNTVSIGHQQYDFSNANAFDGLIDEVRIYNVALTEEEIRALYQQGL